MVRQVFPLSIFQIPLCDTLPLLLNGVHWVKFTSCSCYHSLFLVLNNKSHFTCCTNEKERSGSSTAGSSGLEGWGSFQPVLHLPSSLVFPCPLNSGSKWMERVISQMLPLCTISQLCDFRRLRREDDTPIHTHWKTICVPWNPSTGLPDFPKWGLCFLNVLALLLCSLLWSFLTLFSQCIFCTDYNYYRPASSFSFWSFVNLVITLPQTGFPKCQD